MVRTLVFFLATEGEKLMGKVIPFRKRLAESSMPKLVQPSVDWKELEKDLDFSGGVVSVRTHRRWNPRAIFDWLADWMADHIYHCGESRGAD